MNWKVILWFIGISLACGCSGSTSGGIKIDRAILAAKGIRRTAVLSESNLDDRNAGRAS